MHWELAPFLQVFYFLSSYQKNKTGKRLTKGGQSLSMSWRPGVWKELQAEPRRVCRAEVGSPEAPGHVGSEKGGAGHLKKYIYTVHVHT